MDLSTVVGVASVFVLICTAIITKGQIKRFLDISSILIVVGGSIASCIISYPFEKLKDAVKITKQAFTGENYDINATIEKFVEFSYTAKKEGLLALESSAEDIEDDFIKKGIMLIVDGTNAEMIKKILWLDVENMQDRHQEGEGIFRTLGKYAPAFGMLGTLVGLILMLNNLSDTASLGPSMGVALITTFYGALLANGVFLPIADKLKYKSDRETVFRMMVIEGLLSVLEGESPYLIREKLKTFVQAKERGNEKADEENEEEEKEPSQQSG